MNKKKSHRDAVRALALVTQLGLNTLGAYRAVLLFGAMAGRSVSYRIFAARLYYPRNIGGLQKYVRIQQRHC